MGKTSPENPADFFSLTHLFVSSNYRSLAKSMILANCPARKLVSQFKSVSLSQSVRLVVDQSLIYSFSQLVKEVSYPLFFSYIGRLIFCSICSLIVTMMNLEMTVIRIKMEMVF